MRTRPYGAHPTGPSRQARATPTGRVFNCSPNPANQFGCLRNDLRSGTTKKKGAKGLKMQRLSKAHRLQRVQTTLCGCHMVPLSHGVTTGNLSKLGRTLVELANHEIMFLFATNLTIRKEAFIINKDNTKCAIR